MSNSKNLQGEVWRLLGAMKKWQLAQKVFLVLFRSYVRIVFDIHRGHSLHSQQRQEKKSTEHYRGKSTIHCLVIWKVNRGTFVFSLFQQNILIIIEILICDRHPIIPINR
jgi:hypothetical protein